VEESAMSSISCVSKNSLVTTDSAKTFAPSAIFRRTRIFDGVVNNAEATT